MIKLKKIINQLDDEVYKTMEDSFIKTRADNYLCLLQSYRKNKSDDEILASLNQSPNSFYVLKSRLYDKIQTHLSGDITSSRDELLRKLNLVNEMCLKESREVATAYLKKLEEDLLEYDLHHELIIVYSALKKLHLFSEKYFHYSQLFNKHIAFSLSLEKSEEILGNFNRALAQYDFSRSQRTLETLMFIRREINDHYNLNPSRQVEIIRNLIEIQLGVFCKTSPTKDIDVRLLLEHTQAMINELPVTSLHKSWLPVVDFLFFEYYLDQNNGRSAGAYFEKVNAGFNTLPLYSNIAMAGHFFASKIVYLRNFQQGHNFLEESTDLVMTDPADTHTNILKEMHGGMISFFTGNYKEAALKLNKILNDNSFKDFFHISTDLKLTLAYIYIQLREESLAESILKALSRKIKSEKIENYANVLDIIKVFEMELKNKSRKSTPKQVDAFTLFCARNKNENEVLAHLMFDLKQKFR